MAKFVIHVRVENDAKNEQVGHFNDFFDCKGTSNTQPYRRCREPMGLFRKVKPTVQLGALGSRHQHYHLANSLPTICGPVLRIPYPVLWLVVLLNSSTVALRVVWG